MTRLALAVLWLLHFLPRAALAAAGAGAGALLHRFAGSRRRVVLTNLALCFPDLDEAGRRELARRHFRAFGRSLFERTLQWWGSERDLRAPIRVEGLEHLDAVAGRPVVILAPHFVGLDFGGSRLVMDRPMVSMYQRQKNPHFDRVLLAGRLRFGKARVFARQASLRPALRAMREGSPFYYLPDMDLGPRDAVFVPFFGVQAATVTALARICRLARAVVVPCVTRQLGAAEGYVATLYPAWENFPSGDDAADARRMNAFIEERVREMPEQYYWLHKRFKTRPPGEASPYA